MEKVNFLYFEDDDGTKTNVAFVPGYYWGESLEDVTVRCEIVAGKLVLTAVFENGYTSNDIKNMNKELKHFSTGVDAWEFFQFYPTKELKDEEDTLILVADEDSSTFKAVNSTQNLKNIKSFSDKFNK